MNNFANRLPAFVVTILLLAGCGLADSEKTGVEGNKFVSAILTDQIDGWKPDKLVPVLSKKVSAKDVEKIVTLYSESLGPLKSFSVPKSDNGRASVYIGTEEKPNFTGTYSSKLVCANGPADFTAAVSRYGTKWQLDSLDIESELIRTAVEGKIAPAAHEANVVLHKALDTWDPNVIVKAASVKMGEDIKRSPLVLPGIFKTSSLALGKVKKYPKLQLQGLDQINGVEVVKGALHKIQFEKGEADVFCSMVNEDGKWKVAGFKIEVGRGRADK